MFGSLFTNIAHAGFNFQGGTVRRAVTRAASLAAIAALSLGALSSPAVAQVVRDHRTPGGGIWTVPPVIGGTWTAQPTGTPLRVYLASLYCADESNDNTWPNPDHDEPYVVIFSADLRGGGASGRVFTTQEFSDVDNDESRSVMLQFWSLNGDGSPIGSSDDFIFLAALMESDNSNNRTAVQNKVSSVLIPKLAAYRQSGMSRATMVSNLRADMDLAIETSRDDYDDEDDRVGGIYEVFWGPNELNAARAGHAVDLMPSFVGSDSRYTLTFRLQ
jgi:hypothetical protein